MVLVIVVILRVRRPAGCLADSDYGPLAAYKTAAAQVILIPVDAEVVFPELRWIIGCLLLFVFLTAGWTRAALYR
jgi:hypothetical protein